MRKVLFIAFMLASLISFAQSGKQRLVIWQKNGQKIYYDLNEEPRTTFASGKFVITTSSLRTEYPLNTLLRYTYEGISTAIATPEASGMGFTQRGDDIAIRGLEADAEVLLYDTRGTLLDRQHADGQAPVHFSLANRPVGIYIVKLGDQSLKFIKQ